MEDIQYSQRSRTGRAVTILGTFGLNIFGMSQEAFGPFFAKNLFGKIGTGKAKQFVNSRYAVFQGIDICRRFGILVSSSQPCIGSSFQFRIAARCCQ